MAYLRRLVLLLVISTSILLVTMHLFHISRHHNNAEPLHPVLSKEEAEKQFRYLKTYDHPPPAAPIAIPNPEYADKLAHGDSKPAPPTQDDVLPPANDRDELAKKLYPKLPASRIAPPNATAWHKDKNLWKVKDALDV